MLSLEDFFGIRMRVFAGQKHGLFGAQGRGATPRRAQRTRAPQLFRCCDHRWRETSLIVRVTCIADRLYVRILD